MSKKNKKIEEVITVPEKVEISVSSIEEINVPKKEEVKTYLGKKIVSENKSMINEKEYISITLEDGSICQLSENEYNDEVKNYDR